MMTPDRLHARIRAQLELPSPDLEARPLAAEVAALAARARERLEQCAALVRIGNEQAALEAAEAEPRLLDLCAWLGFADADRWQRLCRENGLPAAPALDDAQIVTVELLYGKPIDESHPLYRDYRQAIRERDDARALNVLRTIVAANPGDANARAELARLGAKFARENSGKVRALFAAGKAEAAAELMERMERLGVACLAGDPEWDESLRLRRSWAEERARLRLGELARQSRAEMAEGRWESCAAAVGAARTLERNAGLRAAGEAAALLSEAESWAGVRVAAAQAEAAAAAAARALLEELAELRDSATRSTSAQLLRRLRRWQELAAEAGERIPPEAAQEAEALRRQAHRRLVRRHTLLTAGWLALLLALLAAGRAALGEMRTAELREDVVAQAERLADEWELEAASRRLDELGDPGLLEEPLRRRADAARALLAERAEAARRLEAEARFLGEAAKSGVTPSNFAELGRRSAALRKATDEVGPATRRRLLALVGDLDALIARAQAAGRGLAPEVRSLAQRLELAMGEREKLADPAAARELAARIRGLLDIPEARAAVGAELADRALAGADRAEERLRREAKAEADARKLADAGDLRAYLAALSEVAAAESPTPESRAASAVAAAAGGLTSLPRSALGPRVGAMWDALPEAAAGKDGWSAAELTALARVTDDRLIRGARRFIIREHSGQGERATAAIIVSGDVTRELRRFKDGTETVTGAQVLRRNGELTAESWSLRRFTNGAVSGEELTEGLPLQEQEYLRRFLRSFDPVTRRPGEPLLRTIERVRSESGSPLLRAYHLQELLAIASLRPAASNLTFSPSAQSDAGELRRLTQNGLSAIDFLFPDKWSDVRPELERFLSRPAVAYTEEARFLRATLGAARESGLTFAGRVGLDGRPLLREATPGVVLLGLAADGQPAALFQTDAEGKAGRLRDPLPLTPLVRLTLGLEDAARRAGPAPAGMRRPTEGWDSLAKGQDL